MIFTHKNLTKNFKPIFNLAENEDIGSGDITTLALPQKLFKQKARLIAKQKGVICGLPLIEYVFKKKKITYKLFKKDGDQVKEKDVVLIMLDNWLAILTYERIILNLLQRLSGIATSTYLLVKELKGSKIQLLDTRKTIPGYRFLEKYATFIGGVTNHRLGLYDQFLIKDNHINLAGGINNILNRVIQIKGKRKIKITIECRNLKEVEKTIQYKEVDQILLDNFPLTQLRKASRLIHQQAKNKGVKIEVSGNIGKNNIKKISVCDIDFISVGEITHSAPILDLSLLIA